MNYEWELASKRGQKGIGYVEVHNTVAEGHHIKAIISYFPQITGRPNQKHVNVCLLFEGKKRDLTDGLAHWIYDDLGEIAKQKENDYFERNSEVLEYMITQTFILDRIPQLELIANGDYTIC